MLLSYDVGQGQQAELGFDQPAGRRANIRTEPMTFGERIRELRQGKHLTLRDLAADVNVTFTYLSKIENQKLSYGEFPSEEMILKLAKALEADLMS